MMGSEQVWKDKWAALPLDDTGTLFAMNIANAIGDLTDTLFTTLSVTSTATFTFNRSIMAAQLSSLVPSAVALVGVTKIADAWQTAILASTMVVPPGAFVGLSTPATLYSVVAPTVCDPSAGYAGLIPALLAAPVAASASDSVFPVELRKAFSLVKYTISGMNSVPPPAGPNPLTAISTVQ